MFEPIRVVVRAGLRTVADTFSLGASSPMTRPLLLGFGPGFTDTVTGFVESADTVCSKGLAGMADLAGMAGSVRTADSGISTRLAKAEGESFRAPGRRWPIPLNGAGLLSSVCSFHSSFF